MNKVVAAKVLIVESDSQHFDELEDIIWGWSEPSGVSCEINKNSLYVYYPPARFPSDKFIEKLNQLPSIRSVKSRTLFRQDWNRRWQSSVKPVWITDRVVVVAPFHRSVSRKGIKKIIINPAMAFGTGHHESTQGIMKLMYKHRSVIRGKRAADFGSGSGILSIFARMLGADMVDAYDCDPECSSAIYENIGLNKMDGINFYNRKIKGCSGRYEIIFANMLFGEIALNRRVIIRSLAREGYIFFAGILDCEIEQLLKLFCPMKPIDRIKLNDWVSLLLVRK